MRQLIFLLTVVATTITSLDIQALDVGLSLNHESEYTTNSARTETNEIDEWIHSPGASLAATHEGPSINLDVVYEFKRLFYEKETFDDDNEAAGHANLVWNALPERLDFIVNHTRTQSAIRLLDAATPDNRQESVYTTAGPRLHFNPRGEDEILIEYLYGDRFTDVTDTNAVTHNASARYTLALSPTNKLTLAAIRNEVQWEDPADPDLKYNIAQLTLDRETRNLNYSLTGGYNRTMRTLGRDDVDGFVFDVGAEWQARPGTIVTFLAARDIRDQTYTLTSGVFATELDFDASSASAEVFVSDRFGIGISQRIDSRTSLDLSAIVNNEDYEDSALGDDDNEGEHFRISLTRRLSEQLGLAFSVNYDPLDFPDLDEERNFLSGSVVLEYAIGRRLNLAIGARYEERDSQPTSSTINYDEWSASIRISYDVIQSN